MWLFEASLYPQEYINIVANTYEKSNEIITIISKLLSTIRSLKTILEKSVYTDLLFTLLDYNKWFLHENKKFHITTSNKLNEFQNSIYGNMIAEKYSHLSLYTSPSLKEIILKKMKYDNYFLKKILLHHVMLPKDLYNELLE